jgi:hypothetical protein
MIGNEISNDSAKGCPQSYSSWPHTTKQQQLVDDQKIYNERRENGAFDLRTVGNRRMMAMYGVRSESSSASTHTQRRGTILNSMQDSKRPSKVFTSQLIYRHTDYEL